MTRTKGRRWPAVLAMLVLVAGGSGGANAAAAQSPASGVPQPTLRAECGPGSKPETARQGRVPASDWTTGRVNQGYTCNMEVVGRFASTGGFKVERYVDAAGHECAYYDTATLFPTNAPAAGTNLTGVYVLDMSNPAQPVKTANLLTPAMESPHESLLVNTRRGLLAAVLGNLVAAPGVVDVYDVSQDCRQPVLKASAPTGILGHESGFAPDGRTFYAASLATGHLTPVDVSNPSAPVTVGVYPYASHGLSISDDGNRAYLAARVGTGAGGASPGLIILDVSQVQARVPDPQVRVVSTLTWDFVSIPQITIPVRIAGHPYVIEMDEFSGLPAPPSQTFDPTAKVGAARIIDVADETKPRVISEIRLEVHQPEHRAEQAADPGAANNLGGYSGHYCSVPRRDDPGVVACTFMISGLRLFDIRDPHHPKEIAYFNPPPPPPTARGQATSSSYASPSFVPERGEIWYADTNSGFYAVRVTNGVWPFAEPARPEAAPAAGGKGTTGQGGGGSTLPATGIAVPLLGAALAIAAATGLRRLRGRS